MLKLSKYFLLLVIIFFMSANNIFPSSKTNQSKINNLIAQADSVYKVFKEKLNVYNFAIVDKYPLVTLPEFDNTFTTNNKKIDIKVNLPSKVRYADIYIFINNQKIDLYYNVHWGQYIFRDIRLFTGKNNIEVFYVIGDTRSQSTTILINKE